MGKDVTGSGPGLIRGAVVSFTWWSEENDIEQRGGWCPG
jgi:hypothetical protein